MDDLEVKAKARHPAINLDRLQARFRSLAAIGADPSGQGVHRPSFSPADMEARRWLCRQMEAVRTRSDSETGRVGYIRR